MKVLNFGSLNIDHVFQVAEIVRPGQTIDSLGVENFPGGKGMNPQCRTEGICVNNFFGTYLLGPLLILNPPFTRELLRRMTGEEAPMLAFEEDVTKAYQVRLQECKAEPKRFH